ncbi:MAG: tetratricopeptide repeat protein [Nitrospirae bacterium]|nr:tetratricopeptide repeat protein [Nitrospirota bacterium]MBF0533860.1 tetratricopeptide repeat protein [Nitrospirota bacterium]MBF0615431.1 tetratricopeptide repeat protein [Nitrospirota bacterium]
MKRHFKLFLLMLIIAIAILPQMVAADSAEEVFKKASAFYVSGKYDDALKQYETLVKEGYESGNLYYNMGNCYIKKNNIGNAILYYEKAKRLIPSDNDLRANSEYADSLVKNRQSIGNIKSWIERRIDKVFDIFTTNGLTVFLLLLYVFIMAILTISIYFEKIKKYANMIILIATCLFLLSSYVFYERISLKEAVVLVERADVRYEPFEKATVFFTMYEGMMADVVDVNNEWYKIKRSDGKTGWVRISDIGVI